MNSLIIATNKAYSDFAKLILAELCPESRLEAVFASEIVRLTWRLEQPDTPEELRNAATNAIRRHTAELRRLQTDRQLKAEHNLKLPGLISAKDILRCRKTQKIQNEPKSAEITGVESSLHVEIQQEQSKQLEELKKRTQLALVRPPAVGRNASCPCGSGQKHKRCCGHWSKAGRFAGDAQR